MLAYSGGMMKMINDYFRKEFRVYLDEEMKKVAISPKKTDVITPNINENVNLMLAAVENRKNR